MNKKAFTLIELLIVVLIIAILAAIAVPNFLEFQTRAKVSRVKSDMRSLSVAIEAYMVDNDEYPMFNSIAGASPSQNRNRGPVDVLIELSTPIAYMSSVNLPDPFVDDAVLANQWGYYTKAIWYHHIARYRSGVNPADQGTKYKQANVYWALRSFGPDRDRDSPSAGGDMCLNLAPGDPNGFYPNYEPWQYDPTNGTTSDGDIVEYQGKFH